MFRRQIVARVVLVGALLGPLPLSAQSGPSGPNALFLGFLAAGSSATGSMPAFQGLFLGGGLGGNPIQSQTNEIIDTSRDLENQSASEILDSIIRFDELSQDIQDTVSPSS